MTFGTVSYVARLDCAWIRPDNAAADAKDIFAHGVGDDQALGASTSSRNTSSARNGRPQPRHDLSADLAHLLRSGNVGRNDAGDRPARSGRCSRAAFIHRSTCDSSQYKIRIVALGANMNIFLGCPVIYITKSELQTQQIRPYLHQRLKR